MIDWLDWIDWLIDWYIPGSSCSRGSWTPSTRTNGKHNGGEYWILGFMSIFCAQSQYASSSRLFNVGPHVVL